MGDTVQKTLTFLFLLTRWTNVDGACLKFSSHATLHKTAVVGGVCYYGFDGSAQYADAEELCWSEGTKLPDFQVEATQERVSAALGSQYVQHWLGLKKVDGVWKWWDVVTKTGTDMTSPRWEGGSSGEVAYSQTSNMGGMWRSAPLTNWYSIVCQEAGVPTTTGEPSTSTTVLASTIPVPATTTPEPIVSISEPATTTTVPVTTSDPTTTTSDFPASCSRSFDGDVVATTFNKRSSLTGVEETSIIMALSSITGCARTCVANPDCCSFVFDVTTKACRHFRPTLLGTDVTPSSWEMCYTVV